MKEIGSAVFVIVGFLAIVLVISFALSYPLMLLWNGCLVPACSGIQEVSWMQMWGIAVLVSVLFKSNSTTSK